MDNLTTASSVSVGASAAMHIKDIKKRYPGNKTLDEDISRSLLLTTLGILAILLSIALSFVFGLEFWVALCIGLIVGTAILIGMVIYNKKVLHADLDIARRILLDEGYGQYVWVNGEAYFTDYTKTHTPEEATEMVKHYLINGEAIPTLNIYKLLDIKHTETKKYRGKTIEVIGFTIDFLTNPVKTGNERLDSYRFAIHHQNPLYPQILSLPEFAETEEDRVKDKKFLRNSFYVNTVALGLLLWMPTTNVWFLVLPGLAIWYAWSCTTSEITSHKITRFLLRTYIILTSLIGIIFIYMKL